MEAGILHDLHRAPVTSYFRDQILSEHGHSVAYSVLNVSSSEYTVSLRSEQPSDRVASGIRRPHGSDLVPLIRLGFVLHPMEDYSSLEPSLRSGRNNVQDALDTLGFVREIEQKKGKKRRAGCSTAVCSEWAENCSRNLNPIEVEAV